MADFSPLAIDNELIKEFVITSDVDLSTDLKLAFLKAQEEEFKKVIWRNRMDLVLSKKLQESNDERLAEKGRQNAVEYRTTIKQLVGAVETIQQFIKELEA
jgi:hypothetical protein